MKYLQATYSTTWITANRCQWLYKDISWWILQNYAAICNSGRQQNFTRVLWDIHCVKCRNCFSIPGVWIFRRRRVSPKFRVDLPRLCGNSVGSHFHTGGLGKVPVFFEMFTEKTSFQWDLIYAHKYLTS